MSGKMLSEAMPDQTDADDANGTNVARVHQASSETAPSFATTGASRIPQRPSGRWGLRQF
jgi:hypothetical protein